MPEEVPSAAPLTPLRWFTPPWRRKPSPRRREEGAYARFPWQPVVQSRDTRTSLGRA
jgi:hypothetical protein